MKIKAQPRLLVEQRRRRVLDRLRKQESVTVSELVKLFGVSSVTIRADLEEMSDAGLLVRSHGGALRRLDAAQDVPVKIRQTLQHPQKVKIAQRLAQMIRQDETLILDSGSTTLEVARQIRHLQLRSLTVITNDLNVAMELSTLPHVRVIMLGGILRHAAQSFVGPQAEHALQGLNADRAFIGVDGLDIEVGLSTPDVLEAQLTALMMRVAKNVVVLADSSKFGRRSLSIIAKLEDGMKVITDDGVTAEQRNALKAIGVELIVV